jgi:hypothetical protein
MLGVGVRWTVVRSGAFITPTFDVGHSDSDRFEDLHVRRAFDDVLASSVLEADRDQGNSRRNHGLGTCGPL